MRKIRVLSATAVAVIACALLAGCKKYDLPGSPFVNCRIVETGSRDITYNASGNPTSARFKVDPDATGNPTFYFVYDAKQRLIAYGGGSDHHLTYNSKGQATIDTLIMNYAGQDDRYARRLFYDNYGRVIKVIEKQYYTGSPDSDIPSVFEETTALYKYDNRGNLIIPGVSYDNKTAVFRTNPVWMQVHLNYSVNNPTGSSGYNAQGLPRDYNGEFLERYYDFGIIYSCDGGKGK